LVFKFWHISHCAAGQPLRLTLHAQYQTARLTNHTSCHARHALHAVAAAVFKALAPLLKLLAILVNLVGPWVIRLYALLYAVYKRLPTNVIGMLLGLAFT
jgi:hypothetical protein